MTIESRHIKDIGVGAGENGAGSHPERFDPTLYAGSLMDSDHRGRYHWAAQLMAGRSVLDAACGTGYGTQILAGGGARKVTGLDLDCETVAGARRRYGTDGVEFIEGDLGELELADDSFDLAVCFEAIEHLSDPAKGIAELRRVVRPGGTLVVSSPNPTTYPKGNPYHLHELTPTELLELVEGHFDHVTLHLQHAWLASLIEPTTSPGGPPRAEGNGGGGMRLRRAMRRAPEEATFGLVVGSDDELEPLGGLLSLGDPFEVRWWEEQVSLAADSGRAAASSGENGGDPIPERRARLREVEAAAAERIQEAEEARASMAERLECQNREAARALGAAEERERQAQVRLKDTGAALLEANQELAESPLLKHRLAELYRENAELEAFKENLLCSRSWRWTRGLRNLSAFLKLTR